MMLVALMLIGAVASADEAATQPATEAASHVFDVSEYSDDWLTSDRDEDGRIDYAVQIDDLGNKTREAMDFNFDGRMDDFYFYSNDVLQTQQIDSNFDSVIDIWIYMWRGVYVRRWERDTDYDGEVDLVRDYDEQKE